MIQTPLEVVHHGLHVVFAKTGENFASDVGTVVNLIENEDSGGLPAIREILMTVLLAEAIPPRGAGRSVAGGGRPQVATRRVLR